MNRGDHLVVVRGELLCAHCGTRRVLPASALLLVAITEAFVREHVECRPPPSEAHCPNCGRNDVPTMRGAVNEARFRYHTFPDGVMCSLTGTRVPSGGGKGEVAGV